MAVADGVMERVPALCRREFCVGNIAPDCNIENEDWSSFTPSREVTHCMSGKMKVSSDGERFEHEFIEKRQYCTKAELSFLLGYYAHIMTDAGYACLVRDKERLAACFCRIRAHAELGALLHGAEESWDTVKKLISKEERLRDIYCFERRYLDENPDSGYFTELLPLTSFPDLISLLPSGAVARKVKVMRYMPQETQGEYSGIAISEEEYRGFILTVTELVAQTALKYIK
jgi:hypothetical protein